MRMAWGLAVRAPYVWDAELYERGARALARGMGFSCFLFGPQADGRVPTAYYPVGYPAWLAGFYKVLGEAPWVVVFAGALAGAVSVALVHRMALRLTDARSALAAAIGLAVLPGGVMFASVPMTETLWAALLLAAVFSLVRRDGAPNPRDLVLAGALLAAATYVRPQALVLTGVLPAMRGGSWRVRVHRVAVVAGVAFALVAPWTLRNCRVLDGCVLVSANGGSNLAIGAVPRADGGYLTLTPDDGCRGVRGEVARDRCWRRVAWAHIRRDPLRWLALGVTKLEKTFHRETFPVDYLAVARPDLVTPVRRAWGHALLSLTWQATLVLGVTGALRRGRTMGPVGHLTAATLAVLTATHGVFFGGDRYHLPMVPLLVLLASGGWGRGVRGPFTQGERAREGAPGVSSVG
jgi:4-amino-4-deoxy-L-arabinose transferase-like glycosyltransferase